MCELLGLNFNEPVKIDLSFRGFRRRGEDNPDGWGLAYYNNNSFEIIKEERSAADSEVAEQLMTKNLVSKIFISHVRLASKGNINYNNTHPFKRNLFGKEFIFAHNGTLNGFSEHLHIKDFFPLGETDSEHAFCYILQRLKDENIKEWDKNSFLLLKEIFSEINKFGKFNCLMSDGEYLFSYFDENEHNGLWYVHRKAPFQRVRLEDEDYEIDLAEQKSLTQKGYIIATSPLTNEDWKKFNRGSLMIFKNGEIVFE
ncbi:MAG: class II glutamine amidotransferase [Ignavibacterium sp.]|uniref:class II glutamine amidotransferase n=1 Tax=Ignavibacterium sp. TaxID=2651167 RepID=UPI00404958C8